MILSKTATKFHKLFPLISVRNYHYFFKPISVFLSWLVLHPEYLRKNPEVNEISGLGNVLRLNLRQLLSRAITKVLKDSPLEVSVARLCLLLGLLGVG